MAKPTDLPTPDRVEETPDERVQPAAAVPAPAPRPAGGLLRDPRLAWAVALLALAAATLFGVDASRLRAAAAARVQAQEAAEIVAAQITTFDGGEMDAWIRDVQALSTDDFDAEVTALFDQDFRDALATNEVRSVGEVQQSFVQELDGDEAAVFVLARQNSTNSGRQQAVVDELRMEIVLERVDGRWLADEVAVLGPSGLAAPPADDAQ